MRRRLRLTLRLGVGRLGDIKLPVEVTHEARADGSGMAHEVYDADGEWLAACPTCGVAEAVGAALNLDVDLLRMALLALCWWCATEVGDQALDDRCFALLPKGNDTVRMLGRATVALKEAEARG